MTRRLAPLLAALGLCVLAPACATNPVTGERELMLVSESQEIAMGKSFQPEVDAQMGVVDDPQLQQYVASVGRPMALDSERPQLPWTFTVIDDPVVNAFAIPGGFINITRGILAHMESEAQLAGVLGHEIGHVTARHSARQMSRQTLVNVTLAGAGAISPALGSVAQVAGSGLGLLLLKYGRDDESQADSLGLRYMSGEGYDPEGLVDVMRMLDATTKAAGGSGIPEWLSTHPAPENRLAAIQEQIQVEHLPETGKVGRDTFLHHIDGLVYGDDPRQGYFVGTRFRQPDLELEMDFPYGWQTQNAPQAVIGVSSDRNALVQLSLAKQASASAAAGAFATQPGIGVGTESRERVNGLTASAMDFTATSDQGSLQGRVLFVEIEGQVFQVLGAATAEQWSAQQAAVVRSLASVRRLTDPEALAVQPWRLRVVKLERAMTPAELLSRYGGPVDAATLGLINQVPEGGRLPAGQLAKTVVGKPFP